MTRANITMRAEEPPAEALAEILAQEAVTKAWIIKLPPAGEYPGWMGG